MKLRKQAIINAGGNTVYLFALWFLTVITTRTLGYEAAGTLTLAMAIGNVIAIFQMYGMRGYQSSDMSFQFSPKDYLNSRCVTVLIGWIGGVLICLIGGYPKEISAAILLFILTKTSETFSDVLFGNDQRAGHLELNGYSMMIRGILLIVLFATGAVCFRSLNNALILSAAGLLALSLFMDLPLHNRLMRTLGNTENHGFTGILKKCSPLLLTAMIAVVVTALPRLGIERYCGVRELGFYGNVSTPALVLTTVIPTILNALLPKYGMAYKDKDYRRLKTIWLKTIIGVAAAGVLCIIGVAIGGKGFLSFVYTDEIIPYVHYLYPVMIVMTVYSITVCNCTWLVAVRRNWATTITEFTGLVICLIVLSSLVKNYRIAGAIAVLLITYSVQALIQFIWILKICKDEENANETVDS